MGGVKGWDGFLWIGLLAYNVVVFLFYAVDKFKARRGLWRVSEATLLKLALLGGAAGAALGIFGLHHKVRKPRFAIGVPVMLVIQVSLVVWAWWSLRQRLS